MKTMNKEQRTINNGQRARAILSLFFAPLFLFFAISCQKIEYTQLNSPAYIRVFNSINTIQSLDNKDERVPYLCMLIDPELDAAGMPINAGIVGDFLDKRDVYAPPYPSHIGVSTSVNNPEYPGKETVLVGPMLNGYDLSSWAQISSGEHRIMFYYRPLNNIPFFSLDDRYKQNLLIDTVVRLDEGEVYTMNVLERDFVTKEKGLLLRQETFHKQPLSDSLVYVNFYNYSAKGYWYAGMADKIGSGQQERDHYFSQGIRDTMNVFLTLYAGITAPRMSNSVTYLNYAAHNNANFQERLAREDFGGKYLVTLYRDNGSARVSPYHSFPLWANKEDNGIETQMFQGFHFLTPGMVPEKQPYFSVGGGSFENGSNMALLYFYHNVHHHPAVTLPYTPEIMPNLIITTPSGEHPLQSFATVNTVEVINGMVYLTTIQRRYSPPAAR